jgi:hypothetical protein
LAKPTAATADLMTEQRGGFLIRFDEEQRAYLITDIHGIEDGFSDALSSSDWDVKQWEVCGLLFEPHKITHWALARRGRRVATGKVRVEFTHVTPTSIPLNEVEVKIGSSLARHLVRTRSGVGGKVPPATWHGLKRVIGELDPSALIIVEHLERLRDQSGEVIRRPGTETVAQQRDAVGLALDVFDESGNLRKRTLSAWVAPPGDGLNSFLEGLDGVRTIEDQLVAHDAATFPDSRNVRHTVVGAVFGLLGRKLEVFNVNRSRIESSLGVDLLYFNEQFDAWTLIQYKVMEKTPDERSVVYRPDDSFQTELERMRAFRATTPDQWKVGDGNAAYRLCGDGFFFKLCSRVQLEVLSDSLLPGMYLPREMVEDLLAGQAAVGPRGGHKITFENAKRHISNTLFADLVRDGWVGTRGVSSDVVGEVVRQALTAGRAVVIARARLSTMAADLQDTLASLNVRAES